MNSLYWLADKQMTRLRPYFFKSHARPWVDDLRVLGCIDLVNLTGLRWCNAPRARSRRKTLYNRWKQLGERDVLLRMMEGVLAAKPIQKIVMINVPHLKVRRIAHPVGKRFVSDV
jgi:hypothetical protein